MTRETKKAGRQYGVVLTSRGGRAMIWIEARNQNAARLAVQAKIKPWELGQPLYTGRAYTSVFVAPLEEFAPGYRKQFIPLSEAVQRLDAKGFIDMTVR